MCYVVSKLENVIQQRASKKNRGSDKMQSIYKCKNFTKTGKVLLPSPWRKKFDLLPGRLADLEFEDEDKKILIRKADPKSTENKRLVSDNGSIHIPMELRNLLDLKDQEEYCLFIDEQAKQFILQIMPDKTG